MTINVSTHKAAEDERNDNILIYVNGKIVPKNEAVVSVYDSGFMLGDGIWEGLRLYNGKWAFLDEHIDRLFEASIAIDLNINMNRNGVIQALENTRIANNITSDAHARLMITRGVKTVSYTHLTLPTTD